MRTDLRDYIRKLWQEEVRTAEMPSELRKWLRAHERVPTFVDRLSEQLGNLTFTPKKEVIERAVRDMCKLTISMILKKAEEDALSPIARAVIERKKSEWAELKAQSEALDKLGEDHETKNQKGQTQRQVVVLDDVPFI